MIFGMEPITLFLLVVALIIIWAMRNIIAVGIVLILGVIGTFILGIGTFIYIWFEELRKKRKNK